MGALGDAVATDEPATVLDPDALVSLERSLLERACWYEDPQSYREGVRATLDRLGRANADGGPTTRLQAHGSAR